MLEKLPPGLGHALRDIRPGLEKLVYNEEVAAAAPDCEERRLPGWRADACALHR